ncbi:MAG: GNAT family N-acetyltransferase [Pseudomonadota bacterium]
MPDSAALNIRRAALDDADAILDLNRGSEFETSPMDADRFAMFMRLAHRVLVAERDGAVVGFLIGFDDGADYDSVNYGWFARRLKQFFYIDRIVIGEAARGQGCGQAFYQTIATDAVATGLLWLAAEMNVEPPNEASLRFHAAQGFREVGRQTVTGGKVMSMQILPLALE